MSEYEIDRVSLEISTSAGSAAKSINELKTALSGLKRAIPNKDGVAALSDMADALGRIASVNVSGSSISAINAIGGMKLSKATASNVSAMVQAISGISANDVTNFSAFCDALLKIDGINVKGFGSSVRAASKSFSGTDAMIAYTRAGTASINADTAIRSSKSIGGDDASDTIPSLEYQVKLLNEMSDSLVDTMSLFGEESDEAASATAEIKKQTTYVNSLKSNVNATVNKQKELKKEVEETNKKYAKSAIQVSAVVAAFSKVSSILADCITESNTYIENMNLAEASMGSENFSSAYDYAMKVQDALYIDSGEWIRYQGVFDTLITGLGATSEEAIEMSKQLTQLGYDISSFYNISLEDSMLKIQSGISGELEPLRRIGYDLSVARMQQDAISLGIEESVNDMSQADKVMLRYYEIMTQVTQSHGDMARTLMSPANQIRILSMQIKMLKRSIGDIALPLANLILPSLVATVSVIQQLANSIGNLLGYSFEVDYSSLDTTSIASSADDASEAIDGVTESTKELKRQLMGFDVINNMTSSSSASGTSGSSSSSLDLSSIGYDFLEAAVDNGIKAISERIKAAMKMSVVPSMAYAIRKMAKNDKIVSAVKFLATPFEKLGTYITKSIKAGLKALNVKSLGIYPAFKSALDSGKLLIAARFSNTASKILSSIKASISALKVTKIGKVFTSLFEKVTKGIGTAFGSFAKSFEEGGKLASFAKPLKTALKSLKAIPVLGTLMGIFDVAGKVDDYKAGLYGGPVGIMWDAFKTFTGLDVIEDLFSWLGKQDWAQIGNEIGRDIGNAISGIDWAAVGKAIADGIVGAASGIRNLFAGITEGLFGKGIFDRMADVLADSYSFSAYASGGSVSTGQMFVARESGPELVGTFSGTSGVMNNRQIVESVSQGVASAVASVLGGSGGTSNVVLKVELDGNQILKSIKRANRVSGRISVGV